MDALQEAFKKHGMEVIPVATKEEALALAKTFIKSGMSIGLGGSTSVAQIGLLEYVTSLSDITLFNQYEKGISMEENTRRRREGMLSDLYICGTNALTKTGELINADGSGNRVAAQMFGPKKVLIVTGRNKIVETVEEGFKRIMEIAAPKNIERMNNTAIAMGKEPRHNMDNIGNKWAYIDGDVEGRTTIILVDEDLGF
ncbi:MAG: lactate utilization protein [Sulfurospirillum sp.]|nr:lactate utilization protein [Sulfurospirillum sp.]MBP9493022.1 lactate utilization protein [Sulfurospirillum sp.]MBP9613438.1 lactate utilization protein [Sulfurospirillum sp.]